MGAVCEPEPDAHFWVGKVQEAQVGMSKVVFSLGREAICTRMANCAVVIMAFSSRRRRVHSGRVWRCSVLPTRITVTAGSGPTYRNIRLRSMRMSCSSVSLVVDALGFRSLVRPTRNTTGNSRPLAVWMVMTLTLFAQHVDVGIVLVPPIHWNAALSGGVRVLPGDLIVTGHNSDVMKAQ